ncbi:hypothetical protein ACFY96_27995 [Streptomyces massasporeus]
MTKIFWRALTVPGSIAAMKAAPPSAAKSHHGGEDLSGIFTFSSACIMEGVPGA